MYSNCSTLTSIVEPLDAAAAEPPLCTTAVLMLPLLLPIATVPVAAVVAGLLLLSIARTAHPTGHVHVLHSVLRSVAADRICVCSQTKQ
jgi:hypothetical protein